MMETILAPKIALLPMSMALAAARSMRAALLLAGLAAGAPALGAGPAETDTAISAAPTNFSRYAVKVDPIRIKQPVLTGKAADFKTRLREALQEAAPNGPTFAGHFVVAEWGCGSGCVQAAIIDTNTGTVYFPRQLEGTTGGSGELDSEAGTQYRADSRLMLIKGFPGNGDRYGVWAYEWTGTALQLQGFTPKRGVP